MSKVKYRVTNKFKILILQLFLCIVSVLFGYIWRMYGENKKWDGLVYSGVKVADVDLSNKSKEAAKAVIKSKYIDGCTKKIKITVENKEYAIDSSKLIVKDDIDNVVEKAFDFGKDLGIYEKNKVIKQGSYKTYGIDFEYNEGYLKNIIDIIDKNVSKEPVNASVQVMPDGKLKVNAEISGSKLEKEKLEQAIKNNIENHISGTINIQPTINKITAPITVSKIVSIDTNIASFNTKFEASSPERINNIKLAVDNINGKLLMPGEIFSFNDCVGERTKERGYLKAPIIVGNVIESGFGGGICQVSSTIYNAILKAGLKPIERTHHTIPPSYVELGLDATVDWNNIDFKFKNSFEYPMLLEGHIEDNNLFINIYSNSGLGKKNYSVVNDVEDKTYEEQVNSESDGFRGYKVKVLRNTCENGVQTNSEVISNDFYSPMYSIAKRIRN